jgi:hypothetical protein
MDSAKEHVTDVEMPSIEAGLSRRQEFNLSLAQTRAT